MTPHQRELKRERDRRYRARKRARKAIHRRLAQWEQDFFVNYLTENRYAEDIEPVIVTAEMRAAFLERVARHHRESTGRRR